MAFNNNVNENTDIRWRDKIMSEDVREFRTKTGQQTMDNNRTLCWLGLLLIQMDHQCTAQEALYWEVSGVQESTRSTKNILEELNQQRSIKDEVLTGRKQRLWLLTDKTGVTEFSLLQPLGCGLNQGQGQGRQICTEL